MRRAAAVAAAIAGTLVGGGGASRAESPRLAPNAFTQSAQWDDGRAEISLYDTRGAKYGIERSYETRIIVVKEDLLTDELAKSNAGPIPGRTVETLKLLMQEDIPAGTYSYHQTAVIHMHRHSLLPLTLTVNSSEGCGVTSVRVRVVDQRLHYRGNSYWQGESDRDSILEWPRGASFYDALPLWVRGLELEHSQRFERIMLPGQVANRLHLPTYDVAEFMITEGDTVRVVVRHAGGEDRFWVGPGPDRPLLRWEKADGTVLTLRKRIRLAYWEYTKPGDEKLLE